MLLLRCPAAHRLMTFLAFAGAAAFASAADEAQPRNKGLTAPAAVKKPAPETLEDLKTIETHVKRVIDKVMPCVVNLEAGGGQGSGVVVSADGKILTAGHVSGRPGRDVLIRFPDGKKAKGKTLGVNSNADSGMVQITDKGDFPFVEMGKSADLKSGQWVITLGHPGGFKPERSPPLRLGRVIENRKTFIFTDCPVVGGDSGGPLFDMEGKVVGIHSQLREQIAVNLHVPVDSYTETWDKLVNGETMGGFMVGRRVWLGVESDPQAGDECKIAKVLPNSPAEKGGLKPGDVVTRVGESRIAKFQELTDLIAKKRPDEEVTVEVRRGEGSVTLKIKLERVPRS